MAFEARNFEALVGMDGLSETLLRNHFKLYQGYVSNTNKVAEKLEIYLKEGNTGTPEYAELKRRFGWEFDGMRLHEHYFGNMKAGGSQLNSNSRLFMKIVEDFGSYETWEKDFRAAGAMRGIGWVILYYDLNGRRLFNTWINEHDTGHLSGATPVLVMDVFEHAFMTDYGLAKADYIEAFFRAIDWNEAVARFEGKRVMVWNDLPDKNTIDKTADAIRKRGIEVVVLESGSDAMDRIKKMIPKGAEVANGSSTTLKEIGFVNYLKSGEHGWKNLHDEILKEKDEARQADLRRKSVTADYFLGSVNAISKTGELVACDATGSRVSAYPIAAKRLVLVAGAQKITDSLEDGMRRVWEYVYPLEDKRAFAAYGAHSTTGKWVIIEREVFAGRTTLLLVREKLGF